MSSDKGKKDSRVPPPKPSTRHKRKNYTNDVYGARLPFEDARIIDDYCKANNLDRSEVVRLGLHQFALRQQMRYHKKDPLRESLEQVVAEQVTPVHQRTEEMMVLLRDLTGFIVERQQNQHSNSMTGSDRTVVVTHERESAISHITQVFAEHKQLLEQTLMAVMLGLRLQVNYFVEPVLSEAESQGGGEVENHLQGAILGRERWCETTHKVIARTGKRILFESNLITQEDWKKLIESYRAEDKKGAVR